MDEETRNALTRLRVKVDELRAEIDALIQEPEATKPPVKGERQQTLRLVTPPTKKVDLPVLQDRLIQLIDDNEEEVRDSLRELKCKGDCLVCPHPETDTVEAQVKLCLTSMVEGLGLDRRVMLDGVE